MYRTGVEGPGGPRGWQRSGNAFWLLDAVRRLVADTCKRTARLQMRLPIHQAQDFQRQSLHVSLCLGEIADLGLVDRIERAAMFEHVAINAALDNGRIEQ